MEYLPDVTYLVKQERLDAGESGILDPVRRREARARNRPDTSKSHVELKMTGRVLLSVATRKVFQAA